MSKATKYNNSILLRKVMTFVKPYQTTLIITILLSLAIAVLAPLKPHFTQIIVDQKVLGTSETSLRYFISIFLVILFSEVICRYLFLVTTALLGQNVIRDLRNRVFKHLLHTKLRYFDITPIGSSVTRTISDVESVNELFSQGIIAIFSDILTIAIVLGMMLMKDVELTLISLITFPFFIYATYLFKEGVNKSYQAVREQVAKMNAYLQERISGMSIVQIFSAEEREFEKFKKINEDHERANMDSIYYYSIFFPVVEILQAAALGLVVWYGAYQVVGSQVSLGVVMAFIMYLEMLYRPMRVLADKFNTMQMGFVASERLFTLLEKDESIPNNGQLKDIHIDGKIDFKNVVFSYDGKEDILKDISFNLGSGETLALVGATGAGKSSVINIINRFYDIQVGEILIDDHPIKDFELAFLRRQIGLVLQDVFLFSGTILENITLRDSSIPYEKVVAAAKLTGAHEFIEKMPDGYNYIVRERGATLSTGQKQIIAFVRALVFDPRILILDEATSNIDSESEELIQYAITQLVKGRTSIVIAHRLSTIQQADQIIVMDSGKILEQGSPNELLVANGKYRQLYDLQFNQKERTPLLN